MRLLRKVISDLILTEGAAKAPDLIDRIEQDGWKLVMYKSPDDIQIQILLPTGDYEKWMGMSAEEGRNTEGYAYGTEEDEDGTAYWDPNSILLRMVRGRNTQPSKIWELIWAVTPPGYGPLIADLCIELAGKDGLMVDRDSVSPDAENLFRFYFENRSDVSKQLADDTEKPFLTPNDISDDVYHIQTGRRRTKEEEEETIAAWNDTKEGKGTSTIYDPVLDGDSFVYGFGTRYYNESMNWIYRKFPRTTFNSLKNYITYTNKPMH